MAAPRTHSIVPPYVLARVAAATDPAVASEARTARWIDHQRRTVVQLPPRSASGAGLTRQIGDAEGRETTPGRIVRSEGDSPCGDPATDEAYEGLGAVYRYFQEVHGRDSLDGAGGPLLATVHYGRTYDNAFFDGERMVFGDGDGRLFLRFTRALDVIGHELTHGILADETNLAYHDQTGALNESICDVFGSLVKQHAQEQTATAADWLIGDEILGPAVRGVALRSMAAPGTAYDDPVLGKDPQPDHMDRYVHVGEDGGGVHINSGIPNKAFHDAAIALGGHAWETVGQVWYATLLDQALNHNPDFAAFAAVTVRMAALMADGPRIAAAVRDAWDGVGVALSS
jgi:Zn-dependent metalloprotease